MAKHREPLASEHRDGGESGPVTIWVLLKFLHVAAVIAVFSIQIASDLYLPRVAASGRTEAVKPFS
jgi:hypothetical protein